MAMIVEQVEASCRDLLRVEGTLAAVVFDDGVPAVGAPSHEPSSPLGDVNRAVLRILLRGERLSLEAGRPDAAILAIGLGDQHALVIWFRNEAAARVAIGVVAVVVRRIGRLIDTWCGERIGRGGGGGGSHGAAALLSAHQRPRGSA